MWPLKGKSLIISGNQFCGERFVHSDTEKDARGWLCWPGCRGCAANESSAAAASLNQLKITFTLAFEALVCRVQSVFHST